MRCAKYDMATGTCKAPIRNQGYSFMQEAHEISGGQPICPFPMSNPITAHYANGAACPDWAPCPDPMGTFAQGENFTIMWFARNHAVADQNPATITLYLSPVETINQGADVDRSTYSAICRAPYMSCNGQNGNTVQCYAHCQMPTNAVAGYHTLWWKWDWQTAVYSNCADILVTGSSNQTPSSTTGRAAQTTAAQTTGVQTTGARTTGVQTTGTRTTTGSTTAAQVPATTVAQVPATTGARSTTGSTTAAQVPVTTASQTLSTTGSASSNSCDLLGKMTCVGSSQYKTCSPASQSTFGWSQPQSCPSGLVCSPAGNYIYCLRP